MPSEAIEIPSRDKASYILQFTRHRRPMFYRPLRKVTSQVARRMFWSSSGLASSLER